MRPGKGKRVSVELRARYAETDQMGVVYHANYLVWCEIGRTDYIRALGTTYAGMEERGISLAVTDVSLRYHRPALYDQVVRITTSLRTVGSRALTFDYEISDAQSGLRLVTASTTLVALSRDGRPVSFPPDIRSLLESGAG